MRTRALQLVAVACLVALAGCSGALSGAGEDAQTLDDVDYPEGVSEDGANVSALAESHEQRLQNRSFTLRVNSTVNTSAYNQSVSLDARVGPDRDAVHADSSAMDQQMSVYLTEDTQYTRVTAGDGEPRYRVTDRTPAALQLFSGSFAGATFLDRFAGSANFTPTDVRTVDGATVVVLEADGSNVTETSQANVTGYEATLLVDERGVVRSVEVDVSGNRDGEQFRTRFSMTVTDIGETTVSEPGWLDEARNQTDD